MLLSLILILPESWFSSKFSIFNGYRSWAIFSMVFTAILLVCSIYQRERKVVFKKFHKINLYFCGIYSFLFFIWASALITESKDTGKTAAVSLYILRNNSIFYTHFSFNFYRFLLISQC